MSYAVIVVAFFGPLLFFEQLKLHANLSKGILAQQAPEHERKGMEKADSLFEFHVFDDNNKQEGTLNSTSLFAQLDLNLEVEKWNHLTNS